MQAHLKNDQNCTFDSGDFETLEDIKEWAKGRGGTYTLMVEADNMQWDYYKVNGDDVAYEITSA
jgi:hypothetical protein